MGTERFRNRYPEYQDDLSSKLIAAGTNAFESFSDKLF